MILKTIIKEITTSQSDYDRLLISQAPLLLHRQQDSLNITDYELQVFSQFGDDGIIQFLINQIGIENQTFIEFGVADYQESNTRFLLMNNNWSGLVIDGSPKNVKKITSSTYYWKYDLEAISSFITKDNINDLILNKKYYNLGLLHIDIDGNDYWIWKEIDISNLKPNIVILEYNSLFGKERVITIPYDKNFQRTKAHYSNLYFGASLRALVKISAKKGYDFIGCNSAGNNAYFIRSDLLGNLKAAEVASGYVEAKFRESRSPQGKLNYLNRDEAYSQIAGMPIYNITTHQIEKL
jgi:hypothetical protein